MSERGGKTRLGVIFLVLFIDLVGFSIVFPLMERILHEYGQQESGLYATLMGFIDNLYPKAEPLQRAALFGGILNAIYSLLQFIFAPIWGSLSDRFGRRPILLASISGNVIAYALWAFSNDFTIFVISRAVAGIMGGNLSAATAAAADISTPATRGRSLALVGMAFGLGFIIGPAIGGLSFHAHGDSEAAKPVGWGLHEFSAPALTALALSAVNLIWALIAFHETLAPELRGKGGEARPLNPLRLFGSHLAPGVPRINFANFCYTLLFSGMEATVVFLAAQRMGYGPREMGMGFAAMGLTAAFVQGGIFRRQVNKVGPKVLGIAGLASLIPGFALIAAVDVWPSPTLIILGGFFLAIGSGLVFPALNTMASLRTAATHQGLAMGAYRSAGSLGRAIGPGMAAILYFSVAPSGPYLVGAIGMLIPILLIVGLKPEASPAA